VMLVACSKVARSDLGRKIVTFFPPFLPRALNADAALRCGSSVVSRDLGRIFAVTAAIINDDVCRIAASPNTPCRLDA
jgi:hypothetical protein